MRHGRGFAAFGAAILLVLPAIILTVAQVRNLLSLGPDDLGKPFTVVEKGDFWIYRFSPASGRGQEAAFDEEGRK